MTLLSVVQSVCEVVGVDAPQSVFSGLSGNRTMQEMLSLANEMAQRIAYDTRDWTLFQLTGTCTGDGTTTSFPLPANFKRLLLNSNMWRSTSALTAMTFIPNPDTWLSRRNQGIYNGYGEWRIAAGHIDIAPPLATGQTASFLYLDKNCVALGGGGINDSFMGDADSFRLDERTLKLGMIWQWKANKGSPYSEDMATYSDALNFILGHDSPAPILVGGKSMTMNTKVAYPWPVPTS